MELIQDIDYPNIESIRKFTWIVCEKGAPESRTFTGNRIAQSVPAPPHQGHRNRILPLR